MAGIDINARFDQLEGILVDVLLELRATRSEFSEFKQEMTEFKQEMTEFKQEMTEFKQEMLGFKQEMTGFKHEMTEFKEESENRFAVLEAIVTDIQSIQREQTRTNVVLADAILKSLPNHNERIVALENAVFVNPR